MAVTIPRLNSQTKASTTPASQTAVQSDIRFRDAGLDDAAIDAMKSLGGAAIQARENKSNGMANATINEFHRRMNDWYSDATTGRKYRGYDSEYIMKDMRSYASKTIEDLKLNGFTKQDGSLVPALSEEVFNNKFLPSADSMLINMDSNAINYSSREIAITEEHDFDAAVERATLTVVGADSPILQADASNELNGLFKAYHGGRMRDEARAVAVAKIMKTALETRAKNLAETNPAKALQEFATNENYVLYGCDLSVARKTAVENMAVTAGTNEALASNGFETLPQNWSDQPLGDDADPLLRSKHPFSAAGVMTPKEYLDYSIKKSETWDTKKNSIANEVRRAEVARSTEILSDLGKVKTSQDYNELVEREAVQSDMFGMHVLGVASNIKDEATVDRNDYDFVVRYSSPDGSFNEEATKQEANIVASSKGIIFKSEEDKKRYENNYVIGKRVEYDLRKERTQKRYEDVGNSSVLLDDFYAKLYTSEADTSPQEIKARALNPRDASAALDALIVKAQTKEAAENLARNEGGTFDVYKLAGEQWKSLGNKFKFENGEVTEGDAEERYRFISRFVELYLRKHSAEKPNAQELEQLSIEAYNTYKKEPLYDDVSKFSLRLRKKAADSYFKSEVAPFEERDRIRDFLETGHEPFYSERISQDVIAEKARAIPRLDGGKGIKTPAGVEAAFRAKLAYDSLNFDSDTDEQIFEAVKEVYDESDYKTKETILDLIVSGNNSSLLRILKAKRKM